MKLDKIINEVSRELSDTSYDPMAVQEKVNEALADCYGTVNIPEFKRVFSVSTVTDQNYIYLNSGTDNSSFAGRVRRVKCDGTELKVYSSLEHMMDDYDYEDYGDTGDIEGVALEGRILWYFKIPEEETPLLVLAYSNPDPLSKDNPELTWMPEHVQRKILVNGALMKIFAQIEEEDSGFPVARKHGLFFEQGITEFRGWIARNRQSIGYSTWSF